MGSFYCGVREIVFVNHWDVCIIVLLGCKIVYMVLPASDYLFCFEEWNWSTGTLKVILLFWLVVFFSWILYLFFRWRFSFSLKLLQHCLFDSHMQDTHFCSLQMRVLLVCFCMGCSLFAILYRLWNDKKLLVCFSKIYYCRWPLLSSFSNNALCFDFRQCWPGYGMWQVLPSVLP